MLTDSPAVVLQLVQTSLLQILVPALEAGDFLSIGRAVGIANN